MNIKINYLNQGGIFDLDSKRQELKKLEEETKTDNFWQDVEKSGVINKKINNLKKELELYEKLSKEIEDDLAIVASDEDDLLELVTESIKDLEQELDELETTTLLSGEFDELNCYLEIHPGAGGTESCDWTSMLARMYERFAEKNSYKWEIIDELKGDEAGLKSITLKISGDYAYGYLKNEKGVHRLVRLSPFDSSNRRHTSFASIDVTPEISKDIKIDINEKDLKIVNIMSSAALRGNKQEAVYCATKWGERGYTESLKVAYKGTSVKIVGIYPGGINTDFYKDSRDYVSLQKQQSFMNPNDVAKVICENIFSDLNLNVADIFIERN